jgi:hypothetical protein
MASPGASWHRSRRCRTRARPQSPFGSRSKYLENSFIEPHWWESLTAFDKNNLVRHDAKTFAARSPANTQGVLRAVAKLPVIDVAARGGSKA